MPSEFRVHVRRSALGVWRFDVRGFGRERDSLPGAGQTLGNRSHPSFVVIKILLLCGMLLMLEVPEIAR
jgi:hypothetical protein